MKAIDNNTRSFIFVKGDDDYGVKWINNRSATFKIYANADKGDIIHILDPYRKSVPLFVVESVTDRFEKDGFFYTAGIMNLYPLRNINAWQSWIDDNIEKNEAFVKRHTLEANRRWDIACKRIKGEVD